MIASGLQAVLVSSALCNNNRRHPRINVVLPQALPNTGFHVAPKHTHTVMHAGLTPLLLVPSAPQFGVDLLCSTVCIYSPKIRHHCFCTACLAVQRTACTARPHGRTRPAPGRAPRQHAQGSRRRSGCSGRCGPAAAGADGWRHGADQQHAGPDGRATWHADDGGRGGGGPYPCAAHDGESGEGVQSGAVSVNTRACFPTKHSIALDAPDTVSTVTCLVGGQRQA